MYEWQIQNRGEEFGQDTSSAAMPPVSMPRTIWQVLSSRGISSPEKIKTLFSPQLSSLKDPFSLKGMEVAVERLKSALKGQERVCIYADFDLDGTSGLALLYTALEDLGFENLTYYQPKRLSEGYGVHVHAIEALAAQGCDLIITIDVGITDLMAAEKAKELGVDLIITDHHLPKEKLPEALVVINPNSGVCTSELGHLCGTGVAFFMLLALRRVLGEEGLLPEGFDPKKYLDCFVIGTLTDLVPVVDENRVLCKHGLIKLAETERPGLKYLLQELELWGKPLSSQDVAFKFAPKLNALSRLENAFMPIELYLEKDSKKARLLVDDVLQVNQARRDLQKSAEADAKKQSAAVNEQGFSFVYSDQYHKGVVGLVATKLSQELGLPSFVGSLKDGKIVGSGRAPEQSPLSLLDALEFAGETLVRFGGHRAAAGFELELDRAENFRKKLREFYKQNRVEARLPELQIDAVTDLTQITPQLMKWLDQLGPFGTSFDVPQLMFEKVKVTTVRSLKGGHLKLGVSQTGRFQSIDALWFSPPAAHPLSTEEVLKTVSWIDIVGEPTWNEFAGRKTLQLLVKDLRVHS